MELKVVIKRDYVTLHVPVLRFSLPGVRSMNVICNVTPCMLYVYIT